MSYQKQELLTLLEHMFSSPLFLCCSSNFYLSSLCVLFPMSHVSYSLFIAHSVFANVCVVSQFEWPSIDLRDLDELLCNWSNTTSATSGAGTIYPSGAPKFTPGVTWGSRCTIFSFLFSVFSYFFWLLCFLTFVDVRILITPLMSSNYSYDIS